MVLLAEMVTATLASEVLAHDGSVLSSGVAGLLTAPDHWLG